MLRRRKRRLKNARLFWAELVVVIAANAGDEGKLFGSIGTKDIADAIVAAGVEVAKSRSRPSCQRGALREVGDYEIDIQLHSEIHTSCEGSRYG